MTTEFCIFGLARLTWICNPLTDSEASLKVMRYWKFSQKSKLKQKFFTNSEKEVGNFVQDWDHSMSQARLMSTPEALSICKFRIHFQPLLAFSPFL